MFPFSVEAKNQENFSINKWVEQARFNTVEGTDWLLVISKNRFKPIDFTNIIVIRIVYAIKMSFNFATILITHSYHSYRDWETDRTSVV